ncbi:MAG: substrate-binding domain-containing protein [Methylococcales bacterium]|nr:substrate-binding domain-containing protein [Methylococcales bacterium]
MKTRHGRIRFNPFSLLIISCLLPGFAMTAHAAGVASPPPVEGRLSVTGSVALSNLVSFWTQAFSAHNPLINVSIADPGDNSGIDALINGSTDIALAAIPLSSEQDDAFADRFGYPPQIIPVAMDAVAVFVNDANPLTSITVQALDAAFSDTHLCGGQLPVETWSALGVKGRLAAQKITLYGLVANTGANLLFREKALCDGDFNDEFQSLAGPEAVQSALISDSAGIGFASSSMQAAGIHMLAVAADRSAPAVTPTADAIRSGRYFMSRKLALVVNLPPGRSFSPALQAFVNFALSPEGQGIAAKAGFVALH